MNIWNIMGGKESATAFGTKFSLYFSVYVCVCLFHILIIFFCPTQYSLNTYTKKCPTAWLVGIVYVTKTAIHNINLNISQSSHWIFCDARIHIHLCFKFSEVVPRSIHHLFFRQQFFLCCFRKKNNKNKVNTIIYVVIPCMCVCK